MYSVSKSGVVYSVCVYENLLVKPYPLHQRISTFAVDGGSNRYFGADRWLCRTNTGGGSFGANYIAFEAELSQ